jgi:hypothetical protein
LNGSGVRFGARRLRVAGGANQAGVGERAGDGTEDNGLDAGRQLHAGANVVNGCLAADE